jgi:nitrate reductase beta subunit
MRGHMRKREVLDQHDEQLPAEVGLSVTEIEDLYRLLAIGKYEDRYVIPQAHTELAAHLMEQQGACGLDFEGGPGNCGMISDPAKANESFMLVQAAQHGGLGDAARLDPAVALDSRDAAFDIVQVLGRRPDEQGAS